MSEAKLQSARELIDNGDYDRARALLLTIDHPIARALLAWLVAQEEATRFTAAEAPPPPDTDMRVDE
jgi:hypothetical protein